MKRLDLVLAASCAVAAVAAVGCSSNPTQPSDIDARLAGTWTYQSPPNNNPGGGIGILLHLSPNGQAVTGYLVLHQFAGSDSIAMAGSIDGRVLTLDNTGTPAGGGGLNIHFAGSLMLDDILPGRLTFNGADEFALTFTKAKQ